MIRGKALAKSLSLLILALMIFWQSVPPMYAAQEGAKRKKKERKQENAGSPDRPGDQT
jgi:hypothetical protein